MALISISTNAWGQITVYGATRAQYEALEAHLISNARIEYRQELGWRWKATYPCFQMVTWEENTVTYDFEN